MNPIETSIPGIINGIKINKQIIHPMTTKGHCFLFIARIPAKTGKIDMIHPIIPKIRFCSLKSNTRIIKIARNPDNINNTPAVIGMNGFFSSSIVKPFFRLLVLLKFYFFSCFLLKSEALFF